MTGMKDAVVKTDEPERIEENRDDFEKNDRIFYFKLSEKEKLD